MAYSGVGGFAIVFVIVKRTGIASVAGAGALIVTALVDHDDLEMTLLGCWSGCLSSCVISATFAPPGLIGVIRNQALRCSRRTDRNVVFPSSFGVVDVPRQALGWVARADCSLAFRHG